MIRDYGSQKRSIKLTQMIKILIGPRSIGKTSIGIALSKKLNEPYFDFDEFVEKELNGIDNHIENKGVESYRAEETKILIKFLEPLPKDCNISFGGGTMASQFQIFNKKNAESLQNVGTIIYISPSENSEEALKIIHSREVKREGNKSFEETKKLFHLRKPAYEKIANVKLTIQEKPVHQIVEELIQKLNLK
jgi:shikimate kinase